MKSMQRKLAKIGDIVEIPLLNGKLAYCQYINRWDAPPVYGAYIRVFHGQFSSRPGDSEFISTLPEQFQAFFPVGIACSRGLTQVVGTAPVPENSKKWPLFKKLSVLEKGKGQVWWIYDGGKGQRAGDLPPEYVDLPLLQVIDLKVLEDRIMRGWTPSHEVR